MTGSVSHADEGFAEKAIAYSRDVYCGHGKIEILPKVGASSLEDMAVAYTPGVAHVVQHVLASPDKLDEVTARGNMIALVTDGTAVLGLGDVGPKAAIPVMEGKAVMFKCLAGIDCMPLCLDAKGIDRFCDTICALEPSFSGINIEDVASPHCFEIVSQLEERLSIPVLHDDQFGTATVVTAAVINSLKLTGKKTKDVTVVVNGVGAAGTASIRMLEALGVGNIIAVDKKGILDPGDRGLPRHFREIASRTNAGSVSGKLCDALRGVLSE
jgi:malate dehydrogenase (oxaloacetate-decarboxylating)